MTIAANERDYRAALALSRQNDAQHTAIMTRIAERGGITLDKLRKMCKTDMESFIERYRDGTATVD